MHRLLPEFKKNDSQVNSSILFSDMKAFILIQSLETARNKKKAESLMFLFIYLVDLKAEHLNTLNLKISDSAY